MRLKDWAPTVDYTDTWQKKFCIKNVDIITNEIMLNLIKIQNQIDFEESEANIQRNIFVVFFMHDFIVRFYRSECKIRHIFFIF